VIAIMSFFGWILVVIFAGVGLSALPIDMINQFRMRPKARKSDEMRKNKTNMVRAINSLLTQGTEIQRRDSEQEANSEGGFISKWRGKRSVETQMTEFKAKYFSLEEEFEIFSLELKFSDTNPIVPILKLILGIVFLVTSLLWTLQM
jgi:LMBR1 domain-containing protein 1